MDPRIIFPRVKSLGIRSISMFYDLGAELPEHIKIASREFSDINVNLIHNPTYKDKNGWQDSLREDGMRTIVSLSQLGINNYPWMIECNLYGYLGHPLMGDFIHRNRLVEHFNAFYEIAHQANPSANVIMVPYPHTLMNLDCGIRGWRDWFVKIGKKLRFDQIAIDAHVGVWIFAITRKDLYRRLDDAIKFIHDRGYPVRYVEVGYPTIGYKPPIGWYGWGREDDQVDLLKVCYQALNDNKIPYMQICEFIDPDPKGQIYEKFFGREGKLPRFLGIPVREEAHWGILRRDGREKKVCSWIR